MFRPGSRVVAFFAHTDDEVVCAGTLHRLAREGCDVSVVTFATAATADDRRGTEASWHVTQGEWNRALDLIGVPPAGRRYYGIYPSADFQPHRQRVADFVYNWCEGNRPDAAFILSPEDENPAHRVVGEECERVMRGRVPCAVRVQYPWNFSHGRPNLYVRLSADDWAAKLAVIDAYKSQHFRYRYSEMLSGYAKADGLSVKSEEPCERFEVIRWVA